MVIFMLMLFGTSSGVAAEFPGFDAIEKLPPGDQFRQLSLMILMSNKTGPEFVGLLAEKVSSGQNSRQILPGEFRTPLVRIVDQESMVDSAVQLFAFVADNLNEVTMKLQSIKAENPVLISMVETSEIMEDAIIIRNAVADSVLYLNYAEEERMASLLDDYRVHTVFLRNEVEYADFYLELERITDTAVNSMGGKMDAYQRMFDEEFEADSVEKFMEATEFSTEKRAQLNRRAALLTEQILQSVMDDMNSKTP